jgi:hypothetical protein
MPSKSGKLEERKIKKLYSPFGGKNEKAEHWW